MNTKNNHYKGVTARYKETLYGTLGLMGCQESTYLEEFQTSLKKVWFSYGITEMAGAGLEMQGKQWIIL